MRKIAIVLSSIFLLILVVSSCTNKKEVLEYPSTVCDTTTARFSVEVKQVFTTHCYRCHSAANAASLGGGNNFENYNVVKTYAQFGMLIDNITQVPGANPMPKGSAKMPDCDINKIKAWVNRGYLNN